MVDVPTRIWAELDPEKGEKRWFSINGMGTEYIRADCAEATPTPAPQGMEAGWQDMSSALTDGTRVLLVWKAFGGLSEHVELGKWKAGTGWCNTYGKPFNGDPDAWAPLAPFTALPAAPNGGDHG